jgi:photosystem II stability/assembly factor-like uncharacterized protein
MNLRFVRRCVVSTLLWGSLAGAMHAVTWFPMGPFGGDARSFAADPADSRHIYLGTATGWLYESHDGGDNWSRVSEVGKSDDLVLDHILIDPSNSKRLIVGAFKIDRPEGGLFISDDAGKTWYEQAQMRGQSIRSMARSLSDPKEIVAGTLQGVYRSLDNGTHWSLISPFGSTELHEVESLAIDPVNPQIIYAGTWHLPWKTVDGGEHWVNIKEGIIDDSDVFSIIVDPTRPNIVYASACSGIYKSITGAAPNVRDSGKRFDKIQGIPSTARRTRKLLQDPSNLETVYAGTTEGLYKTIDGGQTFIPMTGPNVIINDVYVDPKNSNHVLLATDRGGVLSSEDGGVAFHPSNMGFSARQISAYAAGAHSNATIYVGVVNDKATGGVFESKDGGLSWQQRSDGLNGRDVFSLIASPAGTLLAGTAHGIYRLGDDGWSPSSAVGAEVVRSAPVVATAASRAKLRTAAKSKSVAAASTRVVTPTVVSGAGLDTIVYTMVADGDDVYAGTAQGLYRAGDDGHTWMPVSALKMPETHFVAAHDSMLMVAGLRRIALSMDGGAKWDAVALPPDLTQISAIAVDEMKNLWVGGTEGAYYSTDYGLTWHTLDNLFVPQTNGIYFDAASHRVLVTCASSNYAFAVHLPDYKVSFWDTGWKLRFARPVGDHLIGATLFDGMVLQPRMVASEIAK